MLNLDIQNFNKQVSMLLPDVQKRRLVLPYIIGMAIGSCLTVKQGNDLAPMTAYANTHTANVGRVVSFLNEDIMIDVKAAQEAAKAMYLVRSRILNGMPCEHSISPEFDFLAVACGLSVVLPLEIYAAIKESGLSANRVLTLANGLILSLRENKTIVI